MEDKLIKRNTKYDSEELTLAAGANNVKVLFDSTDNVQTAFYVQVTNDDSTNSLTVRLNDRSQDYITVKAGETQVFNQIPITALYLSSTSGAEYRVSVYGVSDTTV